jgi:hypothetical protein
MPSLSIRYAGVCSGGNHIVFDVVLPNGQTHQLHRDKHFFALAPREDELLQTVDVLARLMFSGRTGAALDTEIAAGIDIVADKPRGTR